MQSTTPLLVSVTNSQLGHACKREDEFRSSPRHPLRSKLVVAENPLPYPTFRRRVAATDQRWCESLSSHVAGKETR